MADFQAQVQITAQNNASPAIQQINRDLADLSGISKDTAEHIGNLLPPSEAAAGSISALSKEAQVLKEALENMAPSNSQFGNLSKQLGDVQKQLEGAKQSAEKFGSSFSGEALNGFKDFLRTEAPMIGRIGDLASMGYAAAAVAVVELSVHAAEARDEMEGIHTRAEVVYGEDFPAMEEKANSMAEALGRSSTQILESTTNITSYSESLGVAKGEAEQMGTQLTTLAVDIGKAFHTDESQAADAIQSALRGNGRALTQYTIAMNDNALAHYAAAEGSKVLYSHMTDEQKAITISHYLLDNTVDIQKAAASSTESLSDAVKRASASVEELNEQTGAPPKGFFVTTLDIIADAANFATSQIKALHLAIDGLPSANAAKAYYGSPDDLDPSATGNPNASAWGMSTLGSADPTKKQAASVDQLRDSVSGLQSQLNAMSPDAADYQAKVNQLSIAQTQLADAVGRTTGNATKWAGGFKDESQGAADSAAKMAEQIKNDMDSLSQSYEDTSQRVDDALTSLDDKHTQTITDLTQQLEDARTAIGKLASDYIQKMGDINNTKLDDAGSELTKIQGLMDKVQENAAKNGSLDNSDVDRIIAGRADKTQNVLTQRDTDTFGLTSDQIKQVNDVMELQKEQKALASWLEQSGAATQQQTNALNNTSAGGQDGFIKTAQSIFAANPDLAKGLQDANASEFTKKMAKSAEDSAKTTNDYDSSNAKDQENINKLQTKIANENASYASERQQLLQTRQAMDAFAQQYGKDLADMDGVTKQHVESMKQQMHDFQKELQQASTVGGKIAGAKFDARVQANLLIGRDAGDVPSVSSSTTTTVASPDQSTTTSSNDSANGTSVPPPSSTTVPPPAPRPKTPSGASGLPTDQGGMSYADFATFRSDSFYSPSAPKPAMTPTDAIAGINRFENKYYSDSLAKHEPNSAERFVQDRRGQAPHTSVTVNATIDPHELADKIKQIVNDYITRKISTQNTHKAG